MKIPYFIPLLLLSFLLLQCSNKNRDNPEQPAPHPQLWVTKQDQSILLQQTPFQPAVANPLVISVNEVQKHQTIDGFGYTLTGGSALLINQMPQIEKQQLLQELFGKEKNDISISYLRLSIGASDLDSAVYSYNDLPRGQKDEALSRFSIAMEQQNLIPLLKQILAINPDMQFVATPWSPPVWMKTNNSTIGGFLRPEYYAVYANYFVKYIQAMQEEGVTIHAVTPQNEPLHPGNNPSLHMLPEQQRDFIKKALGPAFKAANLSTKIILYDHNLDRTDYPLTILDDAEALNYIDGTAFHLYAGDINSMSEIHNAYPDKNLYFTEQWTGAKGDFGGDLQWHVKNVIIGSMRNWSKLAMEWNLANNPEFGPHTPGGCTECKGALTIDGNKVQKNVAYYIIAHASKFVPPGSVRIASNNLDELPNVAFVTPQGKKVLILSNEKTADVGVTVKADIDTHFTLQGKTVATLVW